MGSTWTAQSELLLVDTCVVLHACELGVWNILTSNLGIAVPRTVVDEVIQQLREEKFDDISLDIEREAREGRIAEPSLPASELEIVRQRAGPKFRGVLDDGELECLACLLHDKYRCSRVCSSDAVVYRFLGWIQQEAKGVSLEEVLGQLGGPRRKLLKQLTRSFREDWSRRGFQEAWQSGVIKP